MTKVRVCPLNSISDRFSQSPDSPVQPSNLVGAAAAMDLSYDSGSEIFNLVDFIRNRPHSDQWTTHHPRHQRSGVLVPPSLMVHGSGSGDGNDEGDPSLLCSVFPCERNERLRQSLSLSLSSTDPSGIGLQSFELRHAIGQSHYPQGMQFDDQQGSSFFGKSIRPQETVIEQFELRNSKHLIPAQELLNDFCSLTSTGTTRHRSHAVPKQKAQKGNYTTEDNENRIGSSSSPPPKEQLSPPPLELVELPKKKTKLLTMLHEVDRRYQHYHDQMKVVVSSFEAVAGDGAATVYSSLASKAMSRHFRCLRDAIEGQIHVTNKAIGEKDGPAPGITKGETPRLRIIDQALRQQHAFKQMNVTENHPWRPQRGLPEQSVSVLRAWLFEHFLHPYPSDVDKHILSRKTGLSRSQVSNWFINARVRLWKPMVEEMYMEETKEEHHNWFSDRAVTVTNIDENVRLDTRGRDPVLHPFGVDQKPSSGQMVTRIDSEYLSSIVSCPDPKTKIGIRNPNPNQHPRSNIMRHHNNQWVTGLDFSSYNQNVAIPYDGAGTNFGGVSLTLGLRQHRGSHHHGVNLAFSSTDAHDSLFFPRDHIEDHHPGVQYSSILDGEGQNLP